MGGGERWEENGKGVVERETFRSHDSSIRTSIVIVIVAVLGRIISLGPSERATKSPPSACARAYNASRASSSAVKFAKVRSASTSYKEKKNTPEMSESGEQK